MSLIIVAVTICFIALISLIASISYKEHKKNRTGMIYTRYKHNVSVKSNARSAPDEDVKFANDNNIYSKNG